MELHATVVRAARVRLVGVDRALGAEALRRETLLVDAEGGEPLRDGSRALLAEVLVHRRRATVVRVAFDANLGQLRVVLEDGGDCREERIAVVQDVGAAGDELDLLGDLHLAALDAGERTAVLLRIRVRGTGSVRTRVDGVENTVAVAIRRAAVLLRIGVLHTGDVGARIFGVDDAVAVAIRRAAVLRGVVAANARNVRARVDVVVDTVVVAIRRTAVLLRVRARDARHVGTRVLVVDDPVGVAILRSGRRRKRAAVRARIRGADAGLGGTRVFAVHDVVAVRVLVDIRRPLGAEDGAEDRGSPAARQAGADPRAETKVADGVVAAEEPLERSGALLERRIVGGGAAEDLGPEEELLLLAEPDARARCDGHLGAERARVEFLGERAIVEPDAPGVREPRDVTGDRDARREADVTVTRELIPRARGEIERDPDGAVEDVSVLTEQAEVRGESNVAERGAGIREGGALRRRRVARLIDRDRHVEAGANAVPQDERASEVHEDLMLDDGALLVAVGVVEDERLVAPIADQADRRPQMSPEVDRVEHEPVAAALRGVEAIEREALCLGERGPAGEEEGSSNANRDCRAQRRLDEPHVIPRVPRRA